MNDKEKGIKIFRTRLKQDNPAALEETYRYFAPQFSFPTESLTMDCRTRWSWSRKKIPN